MDASASCVMCSFASPKPGLSIMLTVQPGGMLPERRGMFTFKITVRVSTEFCRVSKNKHYVQCHENNALTLSYKNLIRLMFIIISGHTITLYRLAIAYII